MTNRAEPVSRRLRGWCRLGRARLGLNLLAGLTGCSAELPDRPDTRPTAPRQLLQIESPDTGEAFLNGMGSGLITPDSLVIVASGGLAPFLVFGRDGQLLRTLGRAGSGPGEFRAPAAFGVRDSSFWVFDFVTRRITTFSVATGRVVDTRRVSSTIPGWPGQVRVAAVLVNGALLLEGHHRLGDDRAPTTVPFGIAQGAGRFRALGTREVAGTSFRVAEATGGARIGLQPFVAQPRLIVSATGDRFALVTPGETGVSVTMFDARGDTVYRVQLPVVGTELTSTLADSMLASLLPPLPPHATEAIRRPQRLPAVTSALADNDGTLWLLLDPPLLDRPTARWLVVDPSGTPRDTVQVPRGHGVVRPDGRTYWAWVTDSLDVPTLGRYLWRDGRF